MLHAVHLRLQRETLAINMTVYYSHVQPLLGWEMIRVGGRVTMQRVVRYGRKMILPVLLGARAARGRGRQHHGHHPLSRIHILDTQGVKNIYTGMYVEVRVGEIRTKNRCPTD